MMGQPGSRVLLVDDDPLIRNLVSRNLVAAGYVVRSAIDGLDAIRKLRAGLPALIISDLNMPCMSGMELLNVVRKRFPQIPVIVISGVAFADMPEGVAADAYCHKNEFLSELLLQTILTLTSKLPLRAAPPDVDNRPFQAIWGRAGDYIICCEDCLREFSVLPATTMGRVEKWTLCVHCEKAVRFLDAIGDPPITAQP
jgi:CheY-like chemotaxis protein